MNQHPYIRFMARFLLFLAFLALFLIATLPWLVSLDYAILATILAAVTTWIFDALLEEEK